MRLLLALALLGPGFSAQEGKAPVPAEKTLADAEKTIRDIFKEEYSVKTPAGQQKLARKLVEQGRGTNDDAAARYVLFREAAELASRSGDVESLLAALNELCQGYQVDAPVFKEPYLVKAEASLSKPEDLKRLAEALGQAATEAAELDRFDVAAKLAQASLATAKKSKDVALSARADAAMKSISELRSGYERARKAEQTLAATPDDSEANLVWGTYLCLLRGHWEKGLPFLSKGADPVLKGLATKDLAGPAEAAALIEVADGWWDLAEKEKNPTRKSRLITHAGALYDSALPKATGLTRSKLEKRIAEAASAGAGPGGASRANRNGLVAWWKCDEGKGTSVTNSAGAGNGATLMGGVEWVPGRLGRALKFDGQTGYLSCAAENLPATNAAQTISFWLNLPARPARGEDILCFSNNPMSGALQAGIGPNRLNFWRFGGVNLASTAAPAVGAWHHCAFVTDGKTHSLYIDGKMENSTTAPMQSVAVMNCEFGRYRGANGGAYFSGALDDLRIYNRPLTEAEVRGIASGNE
jgi:hypothetical protein